MKTGKEIFRTVVISIMMSMGIFVIVGVVFDVINHGEFSMSGYAFTKMALACVATGLGFGVPTFLYKAERMPMPLAAVIHLGIGLAVYFFAASKVGWIPVQAGTLACVISVAGMVLISILIWLGFMKYNRDMAARINEALEKRNG
ncbi:MAG: DUF3021 domain-containing protein [Lachnospiraceae bacterium]|nr:DUF3021 domain-containing protein [Lachnospiraceae bacterium]